MTRSDLLTSLARRTNKNTTLDTATQNRLVDFLNERQRRILSIPGAQHLRDTTLTFTSVSGQADYTFPNVARVRYLADTTNDRTLYELSESNWRQIDPDPQSGTAEAFIWRGRRATAKQPSDASSIFIKSTSASDTNTVYLEGAITGGYQRSVSQTMTGVTAVDVASSISTWIRVDKLYLSTAAVGTITLHEDSGVGTELARITIGSTSTDYIGITLWPVPSDSATSYRLDVERPTPTLAQSNDVPVLPDDFHDLLLLGALMDEYQHMADERYAVASDEYRRRESQFRYWLAETATGQEAILPQPPSQLGPWYPSQWWRR